MTASTTQTLDRAIDLLRRLASGEGQRLVDLQRQTGLTKPTVHRILDTLCHHGLASKHPSTKRYTLGPEIALLAASPACATTLDLRSLCEDHMVEVAQRSGDTSFLTVRSGYDGVCIDRQSGSYPVKAFTVDVGTRRPLGVGAGGVMLLACLDAAEREQAYGAIAQSLGQDAGRRKMAAIRRAVAEAVQAGHACSDGLVLASVRGLAVPIRDPQGKVVAALSLAAIKERMARPRIPQLLTILRTHAAAIEQRLRTAVPGR